MLEINLLPQPEGPDSEMKKMLSPGIVYFLELSFARVQQSQTREEAVLWSRIWASLLHLRGEYLQPGFSQADTFAKDLIINDEDELFVRALYSE